MKAGVSPLLSLVVWASAVAAWSQEAPPPPVPAVAPDTQPPPPVPYQPTQAATSPPAGSYSLPPGTVIAAPAQPYPYYLPPGAYPGRVVAPPPVAVLVPAPPRPSYRWSTTTDALFLERSSGGSEPLGYTTYNPRSHLPPAIHNDRLYSDEAFFPLEAGIRLELTRKFEKNIALMGTYWGLQQWSVHSAIYGDPYDETVLAFSPRLQLPTLLGGLDNSLGYTYKSQIQNAELGALFRLNAYDPYWELDWLWGARYVYFGDDFTLTGIDDWNSATEQLETHTINNLVGVQTGLLFVHGWARFQWEAGLKLGLMANIFNQRRANTALVPTGTPAGFIPYDVSDSESDVAGLLEVSLAVRCRLSNALWLRLGYQFYGITGLALGPRQLGGFDHRGSVAFDGLSIGLQATW